MTLLGEVTTILFIPYVFTPVVLLVCLLSCVVVIRYSSLRDDDVIFIIFAVVLCVILKTSTLSILDGFILSTNQPVFLYSYFSIQLLRNMTLLFQLKLREECYFSPTTFFKTFSTVGFFVFVPIYVVLFGVLMFKCLLLSPLSIYTILIPEFVVIPVEMTQLIYSFVKTRLWCSTNQWNKQFVKYFFVTLHFEVAIIGLLLLHYTVLLVFVVPQILMSLWMAFQIGRLFFVFYTKIKSIKKYFTHVYLSSTIRQCNDQDGDCSICYSRLKTKCVAFPCGHKFHHSCVISWLQHNAVCPLCKENIIRRQITCEPSIKKLPPTSRFFVRLYQLFNKDSLNDDIDKVKERFPTVPIAAIISELEKFTSANAVIEYFADHPEIVERYIDTALGENQQPAQEVIEVDEVEEPDDDEQDQQEEEVDIKELKRLNDLRKRKLIEDNL
ncbi:hypothetical protein EIN_425320 [Entamoeba invadens IP1]|uniref:RING-type domain-containing protein n=1 Tax=Entamoeba invadens IP1 TaxID=370355 RepID=A0A0A1U643_ENTIV|nr:hypothetical protein EIN_425320 [Entamoeba invadens IP1]ELP89800.1 hypothetical protein EIN_425320 [Entamoeba invadens IP1]|eukprot:XP_004256571.1 hypothetical protein EIN_425320 [Entamoeba invadens IP1]